MTNSPFAHQESMFRLPSMTRKCLLLIFLMTLFFSLIVLHTLTNLTNVIISAVKGNFTQWMQDRPVEIDMSGFFRVMTIQERAILMNLTEVSCHILENLHIPYIMYGGTLLGSWRHHDIIPWDDDFDILVNGKENFTVFKALQDFHPDYLVMEAGPRIKFFSKQSKRTNKHPWRWPYVDISFYDENATHIWDSGPEFDNVSYSKEMIFPTHKRPLAHLSLSAPRDSYAMLKVMYSTVRCRTLVYSHKKENFTQPPVTAPCEKLKSVFPFVHRTPATSGILETLKLEDAIIHNVTVNEPAYAVTNPYSLVLVDE